MDKRMLFLNKANAVEDWQNINKNELVRSYIDNKDIYIGEAYLSAIILRYWNNIYKYYRRNPHFDLDIYLGWYIESIQYGINRCIENRNNIMSDPKGPDKVINRAIRNTMMNEYYLSGMQKRKANNSTTSFDACLDGFNSPIIDAFVTEDSSSVSAASSIIQHYIDKGDYSRAFILDFICFSGNEKFSKMEIVRCFRESDVHYICNFTKRYNIPNNDKSLEDLCSSFYKMQNLAYTTLGRSAHTTKLHRTITKILSELKYSKEVHDTLCC